MKDIEQKPLSLYEIIGILREKYDECRFLNKQRIIDIGVTKFGRLFTSRKIPAICNILIEEYNETYSLDENIELAIYDFINLNY